MGLSDVVNNDTSGITASVVDEFDFLVEEYNLWLERTEDKNYMRRRYFESFIEGFLSMFGLGKSLEELQDNPLYKNGLNPNQIRYVSLAADFKRIMDHLNNPNLEERTKKEVEQYAPEALTNKEEREQALQLLQELYDSFKESYYSTKK